MEIKLGIGVDSIVFGMTKDYVIEKFGKPDKIHETAYKGGFIYYYDRYMVTLTFNDDDDYKLSSITSYNRQIKLYNEFIIGKTKSEVKELLENQGISDFDYEEYEIFDIMNCDEISVSFKILFDKIVHIEFGPFFDEKGEFICQKVIKVP